ncbi:hypothetical protein [Megamonas hypermegale]|uniref:hypothetical protein n=1 Tax=Megamonas hypermegale TaxID=158847 RepID=UPI001956F603|nr:hypothetical protein [Megamonas hypermegale]MBM6834101.1 hypothetical protein [Megamonas hypermegale]
MEICMFCKKKLKKRYLYEINRNGELTGEYICEDCLDEHREEYDTCSDCQKRYVYPFQKLDDEGLCKIHHEDDWSDDIEDYIENLFDK